MLYKALANELAPALPRASFWERNLAFAASCAALRGPRQRVPGRDVHFYDEQRTTLKVDLLAVPAEDFLAEVSKRLKDGKLAPPTEKQLQALFDTYKTIEPVPGSSAPGFKEPHRIGLEWIAH